MTAVILYLTGFWPFLHLLSLVRGAGTNASALDLANRIYAARNRNRFGFAIINGLASECLGHAPRTFIAHRRAQLSWHNPNFVVVTVQFFRLRHLLKVGKNLISKHHLFTFGLTSNTIFLPMIL
ncbi:hypothetical protein [Shimia gijangensis]|uniref:hypothetical protein n=1 Tax=Shimia gijangensis TaxID=1470563 RepID=UPI000932DA7C|nr:hypothetical protein [Shimia gijangensis]